MSVVVRAWISIGRTCSANALEDRVAFVPKLWISLAPKRLSITSLKHETEFGNENPRKTISRPQGRKVSLLRFKDRQANQIHEKTNLHSDQYCTFRSVRAKKHNRQSTSGEENREQHHRGKSSGEENRKQHHDSKSFFQYEED